MSTPSGSRRTSLTILQVIVGIVLGPIAVWLLINALPIQSGRAVVAAAAGIVCVAAAVVSMLCRSLRPGAVAFVAGALAVSLLVGLVAD